MGSFWTDNAPPTNTGVTGGNLGGFQQQGSLGDLPTSYQGNDQSYRDPSTGQVISGMTGRPIDIGAIRQQAPQPDPRLTTQPQPYQQGPVMDSGAGARGGATGYQQGTDGGQGGFIPFGGGIAKGPNGGFINPADGSPYQGGSLGQMGLTQDAAQQRLQQILSQHQGGFFGNIARAIGSPQFGQFAQGMAGRQQNAIQNGVGPMAGQAANWMGGGQTTMPQVFAPSYAAQMGPNGPQFNYGGGNVQPANQGMAQTLAGAGASVAPMNPSQQNQTLMQSPDGQHFQYVNQEHVPHYQGLGAQVYNGSSYGQ